MDKDVPYIVYEATMARNERTIKRLIITVVVLAALIFMSNLAWLYVFQSYDYASTETQEIQVDSRTGPASYIGNDGDINIGTGYSTEDTDENTD